MSVNSLSRTRLKRFSVAVEHEIVVYAGDAVEAEELALKMSNKKVPAWSGKVVDIIETPFGEPGVA
jgi:hypothetical protein